MNNGDGAFTMPGNTDAHLLRWTPIVATLTLGVLLAGRGVVAQDIDVTEHEMVVRASKALVPAGPWPNGDQRGMANTLGAGTSMRCAWHLNQSDSRVYELAHLRSNDMPSSPWAAPIQYDYSTTAGVPGSSVAWHPGTKVTGISGVQGTQMDAFGHWGYLDETWDGTGDFPAEKSKYYGGHTQSDVKPTAGLPMQKLGIEKAPPIITSAVLLDAKTHLGKGEAMQPGQQIHGQDIVDMVAAQGLAWRGLLPGDVLYIYTGWSDNWEEDFYYQGGPGLSLDAAKYLEEKMVVLVALDNPFTDAVNMGQFAGKASPPPGTPENAGGAPVHHHNLTQSGIHQIQNIALAEMAADKVWTSCTIILPIKVAGASGAPVNPVAVGKPGDR